jgi:hypothetical protein
LLNLCINSNSIIALFEFKYRKAKFENLEYRLHFEDIKSIFSDLCKLLEYERHFDDVLLYGAFIHDYYYNYEDVSWLQDMPDSLDKNRLKKITELVGFRNEKGQRFITKVNK